MLKAVTIEVMELSDAKGAIGTFKVVDTWNGFKKLQEIHTGDIMSAIVFLALGVMFLFDGL